MEEAEASDMSNRISMPRKVFIIPFGGIVDIRKNLLKMSKIVEKINEKKWIAVAPYLNPDFRDSLTWEEAITTTQKQAMFDKIIELCIATLQTETVEQAWLYDSRTRFPSLLKIIAFLEANKPHIRIVPQTISAAKTFNRYTEIMTSPRDVYREKKPAS